MSLILLGILNSQIDAGAAGAFDLLETQILTSSASSVTFTGLGSYSDYKHLQIRAVTRTNTDSNGENMWLRVNSDTANNYASHALIGENGALSSGGSSSTNRIFNAGFNTGNTASANAFAATVIDVLDFGSSSKNSTFRSLAGRHTGTNSTSRVGLLSGLYNSTTALTSIELQADIGSFIAGSRFSLYGVKG